MLFIRSIWLEMKGVLRTARHILNVELEPLNLSGAEGDILFLLLTGSNGTHQEQLAEQLDIGKAAVSRVVKSLELKGYVQRSRQDKDKRAYIVLLTTKANLISDEVTGIYNRLYDFVRTGIPDEEFRRIESMLNQIGKNLQSLRDHHA